MRDVVSVIIPVYNVEKYLQRCVDSIVKQSYNKLEIILIDDGSTDGSGKICDKCALKDNRIKVIHKKNEGLGLTRNVGIESANGEYITFVDSDDYIDENTIFDAIKEIKKNKVDVVMYGLRRISATNAINEYIPNPKKSIYKKNEVINDLLPDYICDDPVEGIERNFTNSSCTCLFRKDLFIKNNVRYVSERKIVSEDTYMMINLFKYINSVSILKKCYYNYCENVLSLSHSYREDRYRALKYFYNECMKVFDENNYGDNVKNRFNSLFLNYIFADFKTIIKNRKTNFLKKHKEFKEIINDELYRRLVKSKFIKFEPFKRRLFYFFVKVKMIICCMLIIRIKYK